MSPLEITLAGFVVGEIIDILAYKYKGDKFPKIKKYVGFFGRAAKLLLLLKGGR